MLGVETLEMNMPSYKTHIFGGVLFAAVGGTCLVYFGFMGLEWQRLLTLTGICILGALFPDIDTDSKGQTLFYVAFLALDAWLLYSRRFELAAWLGMLAVIPVIGQHRGWIHTWWAMLVLPLPIVLVPWLVFGHPWEEFSLVYGAFVLGYFSHLILDKQLV